MMVRVASMAACLALTVPVALAAQSDAPEDGTVDLDAIDALLSGVDVTGGEENDAASADDETSDGDSRDDEGEDASDGEEEAAEEGEDTPEPSDLTLAFNGYSLCASEAGAALEETGFALDVIGQEALLHCSGQRAAYVNAFYFSLLPHYPDSNEAEIRASAERLVAQSDRAIANVVTREVTDLREIRELDAAAEAENAMEAEQGSEDDMDSMSAGTSDDDGAADGEETPDGESAEDEMEPNAQD